MLLAVLTVVGLLPLSLFALGEKETVTEISRGDRSYESVSAALASKSFISHLYLDFESETAGLIAQSAFNDSNAKVNTDEDGNIIYFDKENQIPQYTGGTVTISKINSPTGGHVDFKNYRQSFSINEENGNKSFYFGNAASTKYTNQNDNYIDAILDSESSRGNDLFFSVDLKMGGKYIADLVSDSESLFCFINRDKDKDTQKDKKRNTATVWISNVGGIYIDQNRSPESFVGYLSDTEYTSISVHVKLSENK